MTIIICITAIVITIILVILIRKFKHPREEYLNLVDGGLGSGKTSSVLCRVIRLLRKFYFLCRNFKIKNDYIILSSFPIGIKEYKLIKGKRVDTNKRFIRIYGKKIYCYDLDLDILILKKLVPQDEVILIIDEFQAIASQLDFNKPIVKDNINEFFETWRHQTHSKGYIYAMDQSIASIFLQCRRRANHTYNMVNCVKLPLLPIVYYEYRKILISDTITNTIDVKDLTDETDLRKFIFFTNPFKYYDSEYLSERYGDIERLKIEDLHVSATLKRNDFLNVKFVQPTYYKALKYDGITEEQYLAQYIKK